MVNLSVFLSRLLPNVIGCSEPLAQQALLDSAIEFCHRSLVVTTMLDTFTVREGTASYEVDTPDQTEVAQILELWHDKKRLEPAPYEGAVNLFDPRGTPRHYFGEMIDEIFHVTFLPTPDKTIRNAVQMRVALRPARAATEVHDILYERYAEGIVVGAMAILMATPDQPFTDLAMAGAAQAKARALANNARFEGMHGRVQTSMSVKMRAF